MAVLYVKATKPNDINPTKVQHYLRFDQTYVGLAATATMHKIAAGANKEDVEKYLSDSRNFLSESILQIKQRFDLITEVHEIAQRISPVKVATRIPPLLVRIIQMLPYLPNILDVKKLDRECREHSLEEHVKPDLHWDEYWSIIIKNATIPTGEPKYPCLVSFVEIVASLPFSNAAVERTFSLLKQIKADHRTSLKSSSLVSLLQCRMALKNSKSSAALLTPSKGSCLQNESQCN